MFQKRDGTVAGATRRSLSAQFTGEFSVLNSFITVQFSPWFSFGEVFSNCNFGAEKKNSVGGIECNKTWK